MKTINQVFSAIECFFTLVFKFNKFHSIKKIIMVNPSKKMVTTQPPNCQKNATD